MKKILILLIATIAYGTLHAQSDFDLTQRWFNESMYNPASVGNSFTTSIFIHGRMQWIGLNGAPQTQAATFDTYVEQLRSGFGVVLSRDEIGYINTYTARISYAYYLPITAKSSLALGLSGGLLSRSRKITDDMPEQINDPALAYKWVSNNSPEFDFGLEYKGPFKLGVAVRHLGFYSSTHFANPSVNIWGYLSSRFNVAPALSVEPCFSYTLRDGISRYEGGALLYFMKTSNSTTYNDRFWVGAMYRLHGQFAVLAGVNITKKIRAGYSFDYGIGSLPSISKGGTHEVFVAWQLNRIFYKEPLCPAYRSYKRK